MRKLKFELDRKSLETIYLTFIRPILEYGDVIWNNCTQYEKDELEKIQTVAARIAIGATKLISLNALFSEIQWETLHDRRHNHQLILFYKINNHLAPEYLTSLIQRPVAAASRYNLRNSNSLQTIHARTNLDYQSFLPSAIRGWNNLPIKIKKNDSVNSFKNNLFKKQPAPKYYYIGNRRAQILHTLQFSEHRSLYKKYISDSPLCSCCSIEDAQHYFFHCKHYTVQRHTLLNAISAYIVHSLKCFLYGDTSLTLEHNSIIFQHVQKSIVDTKRFSIL